jgi:hypothetical protein
MNLPLGFLFLLSFFSLLVYAGLHPLEVAHDKSRPALPFAVLKTRKRKIYFLLFAVTISFCLLCATRDFSAPDTAAYKGHFDGITANSFIDLFSLADFMFEPLFVLMEKTFKLYADFRVLLFAVPLINCLIILHIAHARKNYFIFIYYIAIISFYYNFTSMRQGLALSFVLLAYHNMTTHKLKSLLYILIGTLFHRTAILALLLFFVSQKKQPNKRIMLTLWAIALFLYIFPIHQVPITALLNQFVDSPLMPQYFSKIAIYLRATSENKTLDIPVMIGVILYFVLSLFVILSKYGQYDKSTNNESVNLYLKSVGGSLFIGCIVFGFGRFSDILYAAIILLLPIAMNRGKHKKRETRIALLISTSYLMWTMRVALLPILSLLFPFLARI